MKNPRLDAMSMQRIRHYVYGVKINFAWTSSTRADQHRDNGNEDQQFDEGKTV
jgi:hypothetical protein